MGHKGNDDCFVKSRAANGDVLQWEPHGTECQVCIDVGQQAMQMYSSGASVRDIRTAVEKKFAGQYQNHTPTPQPPSGEVAHQNCLPRGSSRAARYAQRPTSAPAR